MLENVGESTVWRHEALPDGVTVIRNPELEAMLFTRNTVGAEFGAQCRRAMEQFLRHVSDELPTDAAELAILSKGLCYQVLRSYESALGGTLGLNLVGTRRAKVSSDDALIETSYVRLDSPSDTLLIGDTVASGATVIAALSAYKSHHPLRRVYLFSFAGTTVGALRLLDWSVSHNIDLRIIYGLASFGLADNGFDLSFLNESTICSDEYRDWANRQFDGRPASAVGWDFGSQWIAVEKYRRLCWLEATKWGLVGHPAFALATEPRDLRGLEAELSALD